MKYKVGDKVRVRGDLEVGKRYGNVTFISSMEKNKTFKILFARDPENYDLDDEYKLCYSSEMLRPAEFKIWCETEEEKQAVLEELEKEGYVWYNSGVKPTEWNLVYDAPMCFFVIDWEFSQFSQLQGVYRKWTDKDKPELTPSEFTGIDFSEKIIITKTPTGATATYGDKTVTTEGDFEDASRQALAEVLCPFKVGDIVCFKTNKTHKGEILDISITGKVHFKSKLCNGCYVVDEFEPYTEPPYNAKLFCIEGHGLFKQGVVYTVENGIFIGVHDSHYKDLEDINKKLASQFMEIKGGLDD